MKVGLVLPHLGTETTKESIEKIAVGAENEGFDSLWVVERLLWPLNPQTPYPATEDGRLTHFLSKSIKSVRNTYLLILICGRQDRKDSIRHFSN